MRQASPKRENTANPYSRDNLHEAIVPATGLGTPPRSRNVHLTAVAVQDPYDARKRVVANTNRRVDILAHELSNKRISFAAFQEGRVAQAMFEKRRGPGGTNWQGGDRVDAWIAHELAIIHGVEDARKLQHFVDRLRNDLGMIDARIIEQVLGDRLTYSDVATLRGQSGEKAITYYAKRFRDALEALAEARAARGKAKHGSGHQPVSREDFTVLQQQGAARSVGSDLHRSARRPLGQSHAVPAGRDAGAGVVSRAATARRH